MKVRLALAGSVASLLICGCNLQQDISQLPNQVDVTPSPAPALQATTVEGTNYDLAHYRGHPIVIDFFGSWCGPCRQEQPSIDKVAQTYGPKGVDFIGVAMRDDSASVAAYQQGFSVPYNAILDSTGSIAAGYGVEAPPTTVVIDTNGEIVARYLATTTGLDTELNKLLGT